MHKRHLQDALHLGSESNAVQHRSCAEAGAVLRLEAQARAERIQCDLVLLRSRWILRLLAEGVKLLAMDSEGER